MRTPQDLHFDYYRTYTLQLFQGVRWEPRLSSWYLVTIQGPWVNWPCGSFLLSTQPLNPTSGEIYCPSLQEALRVPRPKPLDFEWEIPSV